MSQRVTPGGLRIYAEERACGERIRVQDSPTVAQPRVLVMHDGKWGRRCGMSLTTRQARVLRGALDAFLTEYSPLDPDSPSPEPSEPE